MGFRILSLNNPSSEAVILPGGYGLGDRGALLDLHSLYCDRLLTIVFAEVPARGIEGNGDSFDQFIAAVLLFKPHLVFAGGNVGSRRADFRQLSGLAVIPRAVRVGADRLAVCTAEGTAADGYSGFAVGITAVVHNQRVAGGIAAIAVEAVFSCRTGALQHTAGDLRAAGLDIDRRGAGDTAAGHLQVAGGQIHRDIIAGNNRAVLNDNVCAGFVCAVGADGPVAGVGDRAVDSQGRRLGVCAFTVTPDNNLTVDRKVAAQCQIGAVIGVHAAFDRAVLNRDSTAIDRDPPSVGLRLFRSIARDRFAAEVEHQILADPLRTRQLNILQQRDGAAGSRRVDSLCQSGIADAVDLRSCGFEFIGRHIVFRVRLHGRVRRGADRKLEAAFFDLEGLAALHGVFSICKKRDDILVAHTRCRRVGKGLAAPAVDACRSVAPGCGVCTIPGAALGNADGLRRFRQVGTGPSGEVLLRSKRVYECDLVALHRVSLGIGFAFRQRRAFKRELAADGIGKNGPVCGKCYILCDRGTKVPRQAAVIPAVKGIAGSGRIFRLGRLPARNNKLRWNRAAAGGIEGDCILVAPLHHTVFIIVAVGNAYLRSIGFIPCERTGPPDRQAAAGHSKIITQRQRLVVQVEDNILFERHAPDYADRACKQADLGTECTIVGFSFNMVAAGFLKRSRQIREALSLPGICT